MKIGELAKSAGTPVETVRYCEKAGLLPLAPRTEGNYRHYGAPHRHAKTCAAPVHAATPGLRKRA